MAVDNDSISELIKVFETKALSLQQKTNGGKPLQLLPTPFQLFQLGKVLFETEEHSTHRTLLTSYHSLLDQLPECYLRQVLFHDLNLAFQAADDDSIEAIHAICGLYTDTPLACRAGFSLDVCRRISCVYGTLRNRQDRDRECTALLRTLSCLLLLGGLLDSNGDEDTQLRRIMEVAEALTENDHNTFLGDLMEWQERTMPTRSLLTTLKSKFEETPQREYILLMLQSSAKTSDDLKGTSPIASKQPQSTTFPKNVTAASEIQRRIQQVHDILPELGEGYIETALSCFQGDVSKTVASLLEGQTDSSSLPPALQRIDPKLPARHVETTPDSYSLNDDEARRATKARLAQMERVQEQEAYALTVVGNNEYDDDYDDQYDWLDGGGELGGGDGESYDVDLDTIRTYNRVVRQAETEEKFWEESRNTNRQKPKTDGASDTKTYSGPDKGKGGRVIGPDGRYLPFEKGGKKAGKKPIENTTATDPATSKPAANGKAGDATSSSIQKRRKNQNKAKLANHHRKERAQKKTSQGM